MHQISGLLTLLSGWGERWQSLCAAIVGLAEFAVVELLGGEAMPSKALQGPIFSIQALLDLVDLLLQTNEALFVLVNG